MCSFLLPKLTREKNEKKNWEKLKHLKKKSKFNNIFFPFWASYLPYVHIVTTDVLWKT